MEANSHLEPSVEAYIAYSPIAKDNVEQTELEKPKKEYVSTDKVYIFYEDKRILLDSLPTKETVL